MCRCGCHLIQKHCKENNASSKKKRRVTFTLISNPDVDLLLSCCCYSM